MTRIRAGAWVVACGALVIAGCGDGSTQRRGAAVTSSVLLRVLFDGGYVYETRLADRVHIGPLAGSTHPIKIKVLSADPGSIGRVLNLQGKRLQFWPNGAAPGAVKPRLPPYDDRQVGCPTTDQISERSRNNLFFLPSLRFSATEMSTTVKPTLSFAGLVDLVGGGDVKIIELGGCTEFRKQGHRVGEQRSMASGEEGVAYLWALSNITHVTLKTYRLDGAEDATVDVKPDGNNEIRLAVSSFLTPPKPGTPPYEIQHFRTFDLAYGTSTIVEANRVALWWMKVYSDSPGIDCPPGGTNP